MADHILESCVWVARPRPEVFAFFADPANLARLTPPWMRVRLRTTAPAMTAGSVVDCRVSWLGVPAGWRAYIREWGAPFRFVDVQVRGPFARWEHRHRFLAEGDLTGIEDRVTYQLPLGPLGRIAYAAMLRRQLAAAWAYRQERIAKLVGPLRRPAG